MTFVVIVNGKGWEVMVDIFANRADAPNDYIQLEKPVEARFIRITNFYYPSGKFSISGLRVFGKADKPAPRCYEVHRTSKEVG